MTKYKNNSVTCPLCTAPMEYRFKPARGSYMQSDNHVWVCPECPNIMFEYVHPNNLEDLKQLIK